MESGLQEGDICLHTSGINYDYAKSSLDATHLDWQYSFNGRVVRCSLSETGVSDHVMYLHGHGGTKSLADCFWKDLSRSASEHLRLQWRGQELALEVVGVDGRRGRRRGCRLAGGRRLGLCGKTVKDALHLVLHFIRPVDEVALQLARLLYDPLLPFPEPG